MLRTTKKEEKQEKNRYCYLGYHKTLSRTITTVNVTSPIAKEMK